jgi:hypothetical protein
MLRAVYCIACFPAHAAVLQAGFVHAASLHAHYSRLHCIIACRSASLPTWNVTAEVLPISTNVETFTRNASAPKPQSPVSNAAVARAVPQAVATANAARHRNRRVCTRQHRRAALAVAVRCAAEQCMRHACRSGSDPIIISARPTCAYDGGRSDGGPFIPAMQSRLQHAPLAQQAGPMLLTDNNGGRSEEAQCTSALVRVRAAAGGGPIMAGVNGCCGGRGGTQGGTHARMPSGLADQDSMSGHRGRSTRSEPGAWYWSTCGRTKIA